jgi:hypothetical protein
MRYLKLFRWTAALMAAIALAPAAASAQEDGTLSISGTFMMHYKFGTVGDDLADIYANDYAHGWTLTLNGATYSHDGYSDWYYDEWGEYWHVESITRVHATSFDFRFFGPNADTLNAVVSQQLDGGGLTDSGYFELRNHYYYDPTDWSIAWAGASWELRLAPRDASTGVSFTVAAGGPPPFYAEESGYPHVEAPTPRGA